MVGMRASDFRFIFDADVGRAKRGFRQFDRELGRTVKRSNKSARAINKSLGGIGRGIGAAGIGGAGASVAAGLGLRKIITDAKDFEFSMNQVKAISRATGDEFSLMKSKALELGNTTQFTAGQVGDAMRFMAMAGLDTSKILGGIESTLQLAAAGNVELAESADIVTNILTAYGLEVGQLDHAVDVLSATFTSSNTDLRQLAQAFKFAAPVASAAGIEFEEAAAAIGLLGNAGFQAEMAGTALRGMLLKLASPSKEAERAMKQLGISVKDSKGRLKSLADIIKEFEPHTNNLAAFGDVFAQRAGPAVIALAKQGGDEIRNFAIELANANGEGKRLADTMMQGIRGGMLEATSAAEGLSIAISDLTGLGRTFEWLARSAAKAMRAVTADMRVTESRLVNDADTIGQKIEKTRNLIGDLEAEIARKKSGQLTWTERIFGATTGAQERTVANFKVWIDEQKRLLGMQSRHPEVVRRAKPNVNSPDPDAAVKSYRTSAKRDPFKDATTALNRQLRELEFLARAAGASEGALARMRAEQQALNAIQNTGATVTDKQRANIENLSWAVGAATDRLNQMEQQMELAQEHAEAVTSNMSDAFSQWAESGKLDAKEMVRSILLDLAKLQFQKSVIGPLNNVLSDGFGGSSGLGGLLDGFLATGGSARQGKAYMVGERGPELFSPGQNGTVIPNNALQGGGGGNITVHVETTLHGGGGANLEAMLAERDRALPATIIKTVSDAKQRGALR